MKVTAADLDRLKRELREAEAASSDTGVFSKDAAFAHAEASEKALQARIKLNRAVNYFVDDALLNGVTALDLGIKKDD
jgi:hypothetical protein